MIARRRQLLVGLGALGLAGCVGGGGAAPGPRRMRPAPNPGFDAWVSGYRGRAAARGIPAPVIERAFRGVGFLPGVIERDRNQTEFRRTLEDYLAIAASDERVAAGRRARRRHAATLSAIEARYGVPGDVVTAIWGLESRYGERKGDVPVISALATLAFDGRRGAFFERQLDAALRIIAAGDVAPGAMTGSWAGAMGHTQFIPTSYLAYAVDFTGDGRRDIWGADPTDALASAAAYLDRSGWVDGQPWGLEVVLPAGFDRGAAGSRRSAAGWRAAGVRGAARPVPDAGTARLLLPAGASGPAFLVFRNFDVIRRYNNAVNYAIGIGHLADRIAGGPPISAAFPPDAAGLTLRDRQEIQRRLTAAGYDTGGVDGVIGSGTRAAIEDWERANGLAVTGEATRALLARLR